MTVEHFEAAPPQNITPGAIYDVPWPYIEGAVRAAVIHDGARVILTDVQFTVTPASSDTDGTMTLPPAIEALYPGGVLIVLRETPMEQGWQGIQGPRERGLEAQLDAIVMRLQELAAGVAAAVRVDGPIPPTLAQEGRVLAWEGGAVVPGPTVGAIAGAAEAAAAAVEAAAAAQAVALSGARIIGSVAAMIADTDLIAGQVVHTASYYGDQSATDPTGPIVIAASGQSNANGTTYPGGTFPSNTRVYMWLSLTNGGAPQWVQNPRFDTTTYYSPIEAPMVALGGGANNPALQYAHRVAEATGRDVRLILDARGSSPIENWIGTGVTSVRYASLKSNVEAALAALGRTEIDAFCWQQGENNNADSAAVYQGKLNTLYAQLHAETWFTANTVMVAGEPMRSNAAYNNVRAGINAWAAESPVRRRVASSYGLFHGGDNVHFTGENLYQLGYQRYWAAKSFAGASPKSDAGGATYLITNDGLAADGYGEFVLAGGLRARRLPGPLYWEQFGAKGNADATTSDDLWADNQPHMQAAINFAQGLADKWFYTPLQTNPLGQFLRSQVTIRSAGGGAFGISAPLVPISSNRGLVLEDTSFIAKGTGWSATTYMLSAGSVYTGYVYVDRCYFNCARKASGIKAEARWTLTDCVVRAMVPGTGAHTSDGSRTDAGIGMWLKGPLIEVLRPDIKEKDSKSQDFYDQATYGAVGIYISDTDARIRFGSVGWCLEAMRIATDGGANHKIESIHLFNGMESFADFNVDGSTRVAFPSGTAASGRSYNPNLVVEPSTIGARPNIELHDVYFDNGSIHLYNPSVSFEDCEFNSNSAITNAAQPDSTYWITCWAHAVAGTNEVRVRGAKVGVRTAARRGIRWEPFSTNTWAFLNHNFEASAQNLWDTKPDSHNVTGCDWFAVTGEYAATRSRALGAGCFHGLRDENSTDWSYLGVSGDQAVIRTPNGSMRVDSWDGTTAVTMFRAAADHVLFPRAAAAPASPSNGYVYYDTTTNKLRVRAAGAWVDLH